jgi:hypothetical protein
MDTFRWSVKKRTGGEDMTVDEGKNSLKSQAGLSDPPSRF